jgi:hypothetical protein
MKRCLSLFLSHKEGKNSSNDEYLGRERHRGRAADDTCEGRVERYDEERGRW